MSSRPAPLRWRSAWLFMLAAAGLRRALCAGAAGTAELLCDHEALAPGANFPLGLLFTMGPGEHTYWKNPGDSGAPPEIEFRLPAGFTASPPRWSASHRIQAEDTVSFGYKRELLLLVDVKVPAN